MKKIIFLIALTVMALSVVPQLIAQTQSYVSIPVYWEEFNERTNQLVGKVWVDGNGNSRIERPNAPGDFTIVRVDVNTRIITMYNCNGRTKTYTRLTLAPDQAGAGMVRTLLGREMVEGRMCDHYRITWTGRSEVEEQWIDAKGLTMRQKIGNEAPTVLRNIREAPQSAHLFQIPNDFREQSGGTDFQNLMEMFSEQGSQFQDMLPRR